MISRMHRHWAAYEPLPRFSQAQAIEWSFGADLNLDTPTSLNPTLWWPRTKTGLRLPWPQVYESTLTYRKGSIHE